MVNLFPDFRKKERLSLSNHGQPLILLLEVLSSGCAKLLKSDQFHGLNAQTFFLVQKNRKIALFQGIFGTCFCAGRHNSKWFL